MVAAAESRAAGERQPDATPPASASAVAPTMAMSLDQPMSVDIPTPPAELTVESMSPQPSTTTTAVAELTPGTAFVQSTADLAITNEADAEVSDSETIISPRRRASASDGPAAVSAAEPQPNTDRTRHSSMQ